MSTFRLVYIALPLVRIVSTAASLQNIEIWLCGCKHMLSGSWVLRKQRTYAVKYIYFEKCENMWAVYILARLFAIYIRSCAKWRAPHRSLIPREVLQKFIRTLCCMLCQLASKIYHRWCMCVRFVSSSFASCTVPIDIRERQKCSASREGKSLLRSISHEHILCLFSYLYLSSHPVYIFWLYSAVDVDLALSDYHKPLRMHKCIHCINTVYNTMSYPVLVTYFEVTETRK